MKLRLAALATCIVALALLAGCKQSGSAGNAGKPETYVDSDTGSIIVSPSGGDAQGSGDGGFGNPMTGIMHTPEPATIALLGGGILAYALLRIKKRK